MVIVFLPCYHQIISAPNVAIIYKIFFSSPQKLQLFWSTSFQTFQIMLFCNELDSCSSSNQLFFSSLFSTPACLHSAFDARAEIIFTVCSCESSLFHLFACQLFRACLICIWSRYHVLAQSRFLPLVTEETSKTNQEIKKSSQLSRNNSHHEIINFTTLPPWFSLWLYYWSKIYSCPPPEVVVDLLLQSWGTQIYFRKKRSFIIFYFNCVRRLRGGRWPLLEK